MEVTSEAMEMERMRAREAASKRRRQLAWREPAMSSTSSLVIGPKSDAGGMSPIKPRYSSKRGEPSMTYGEGAMSRRNQPGAEIRRTHHNDLKTRLSAIGLIV